MTPTHLTRTGRIAGLLSGATGLVSLVLVLGTETTSGDDMTSGSLGLLIVAGSLTFASACLLVVAVMGLASGWGGSVSRSGAAVMGVMGLAAAAGAAAASTVALVVPVLVDRMPDLVENPPAAVPALFLVSGAVLGLTGLVTALQWRSHLPRRTFLLLVVASVVCLVPLPSRSFLLGFAFAALLRPVTSEPVVDEPVRVAG